MTVPFNDDEDDVKMLCCCDNDAMMHGEICPEARLDGDEKYGVQVVDNNIVNYHNSVTDLLYNYPMPSELIMLMCTANRLEQSIDADEVTTTTATQLDSIMYRVFRQLNFYSTIFKYIYDSIY